LSLVTCPWRCTRHLRVREDQLQPPEPGDWSPDQVPEGRRGRRSVAFVDEVAIFALLEEVPNEDIVKGYKVDTNTFIEVTKEELENVALESTVGDEEANDLRQSVDELAERLRKATLEAPLRSLLAAFVLGVWFARRRRSTSWPPAVSMPRKLGLTGHRLASTTSPSRPLDQGGAGDVGRRHDRLARNEWPELSGRNGTCPRRVDQAEIQIRRMQMKCIMSVALVAAISFALAPAADAKGCIKGAIVGGVAGHMAGHGKLGAAAGCVIGHHEANKADASKANAQAPPDRK
jgi:hypothetical protein